MLNTDSISDELLIPSNWLIPSVSGNVPGLISKRMYIERSLFDVFNDNRALLSYVVDVETAHEVPFTLTFSFAHSPYSYSGNLNNLFIFQYDEDLIICDTVVDAANSTISAEINGAGKYFVLDLDEFLKGLGIDVFNNLTEPEAPMMAAFSDFGNVYEDDFAETDIPQTIIIYDNYGEPIDEIPNPEHESFKSIDFDLNPFSSIANNFSPFASFSSTSDSTGSGEMGKADIVFVIDTTGSMGSYITNVKNNINTFADKLVSEYNIDANFALVEFRDITVDGASSTKTHKNGSSNWFTDVNGFKTAIGSLGVNGGGDAPETPIDGLEMARRLNFRSNADKFVVLITDADYKTNNNYGIANMTEMTNLFVGDKINVSVIANSQTTYNQLFSKTDGLYASIGSSFSNTLLNLANKIGGVSNSGEWILLDDYQAVKLSAPLSTNNDTDKDGVSDRNELKNLYSKNLSVLIQSLLSSHSVPGDLYIGKTSIMMWSYYSNPVLLDTDYDGLSDGNKDYDGKTVTPDSSPRDNSFAGKLHYKRDKKSMESKQNMEFKVNYSLLLQRNDIYKKDLSVLMSLYASDIYEGTYLEVTEGLTGGSDNPTDLGKLFGLKDVEDIKINGADYSVDTDDSTEFVIGHREVTYNGITREVIVVVIRGTNGTNAEWSSNFDVGADTNEYYAATGSSHPDWKNKDNHKGFDVAANRVIVQINNYLSRHSLTSGAKSIVITGHSRGAAIANLLGAHYEKATNFVSFTYTFAAPNPTTDSKANSYKTIFNIVNKDDIIPYLPLSDWGFEKYGIIKEISVENCYENKWGKRQQGTWEWLTGVDYNNDGGTQRTLNAFAKLANDRKDLYILDTSSDGTVWENNFGHTTRAGAEKELTELTNTLSNEKMLKFCKLSIVGGGFLTPYHVEVNYCPAYLMQMLSNMTTGVGPMLGHDTKGKYAAAKTSFVASSGKTPISKLGGMEDPHTPITYYLIAYNNFVNKV